MIVVAPVIVAAEIFGLEIVGVLLNTTLVVPVVPLIVVAPMRFVPPAEMVLLVSVCAKACVTSVSPPVMLGKLRV